MKVKRILVTGGPVHAHLDAVKIITNRFKGGRMTELAYNLQSYGLRKKYGWDRIDITYLTAKGIDVSTFGHWDLNTIYHDGFNDYMEKVLALAPKMDAVVLGAAVANLIPMNPLKGKFPSHDYEPGDVIPIDFTIAPRIIDEVKKVAPKTHLFGFKLLQGVPHAELVRAAYEIVLESKATAVFANDANDLDQIYMVTKERGEHPMKRAQLEWVIREMLADEYYHTGKFGVAEYDRAFNEMIEKCAPRFTAVENGYVFGTVAMRDRSTSHGSFKTTGRGKKEADTVVDVLQVDHDNREVIATDKASLNAPLLHHIFATNRDINWIIHFHEQVPGLPTLPYAPPGTVRDSLRDVKSSFNIEGHGCFLLKTPWTELHESTGKLKGMDMTLDEFLEKPNGS